MCSRVHMFGCALSIATVLVACGSRPAPHEALEFDPPPNQVEAIQKALFEYALQLLAMVGDADAERFADLARKYSRQHSGEDNQQLHRFEDRLKWSPFASREVQPPRSPSWHWNSNMPSPDVDAATAQAQSLIRDGDFDGAFAVLYVALAAHEKAPDRSCAKTTARLYELLQSLYQRPQPTAPYHHQVVVRLDASMKHELASMCEELLRPLKHPDLVELHRAKLTSYCSFAASSAVRHARCYGSSIP